MAICRPEEPLLPPGPDLLETRLRGMGHRVEAFPLATIGLPRDAGPLTRAARALVQGAFDVVLLTSPRAVHALLAALARVGAEGRAEDSVDPAIPRGTEGWVVGSATGTAAAALGLDRVRTPPRFVAESLLEASRGWQPRGRRILFPRAAEGRDLLLEGLVDQGAQVSLVEAYRSEPRPDGARALLEAVRSRRLDAVALTAGSQARVLGRVLAEEGWIWVPERDGALVAIGPATRGAMLGAGFPEPVVAEPHTLAGVAAALEHVWRSRHRDAPLS